MPKQCTIDKKWAIVAACLSVNDRATNTLTKMAWNNLETQFNLKKRRLQEIYREYKDKVTTNIIPDMKPKRRCGRPTKCTEEKLAVLTNINSEEDGDITYSELREAVLELGYEISPSSCFRYLKSIGAETTSSWVKPRLVLECRMKRLRWVLKQINKVNPEKLIFISQESRIHIDEKWFYLERLRVRRRVIPGEIRFDDETVGHKNHRTKVICSIINF
jgi:hypothetical protein